MTERRSRFIVPLALIAAILAVSTSSIFIRFAQVEAPSLVIAALRLTFATLLLLPVAWTRHRKEFMRFSRGELVLAAFSGLFLAAHFATWTSSLEFTTIASSVVFVSTGPLWVALLSAIFLNERLSSSAVFGLAIAIIGGTVIGISDACSFNGGLRCPDLDQVLQGRAMWGNFLALIGAWTVSGYLIVGRRLRTTHSVSLVTYIFLVYGFAAAALIVVMLAAGQSPLGYSTRTYGWILLLAAFPQLIGHSTYNWALRYIPASFVAITTLVEPVGSAVLAYLIMKETPTEGLFLGGLLILKGIYLATRAGRNANPHHKTL